MVEQILFWGGGQQDNYGEWRMAALPPGCKPRIGRQLFKKINYINASGYLHKNWEFTFKMTTFF